MASETGREEPAEAAGSRAAWRLGGSTPGPLEPLPPPLTPDAAAIRAAISSVVSYPRLARSEGLEGRVVVRFRIDETGTPRDLSVVQSAGSLLDGAAREAVARAAPFLSPPGWVRVPVDFSLQPPP